MPPILPGTIALGTPREPWLSGCSCYVQFTPRQRALTEAMAGEGQPRDSTPFLVSQHSENNSPTSSSRKAQREKGATPQSHNLHFMADDFPLTTPFVLAPDQAVDTPPRTTGILTHPLIPLPPQITSHFSIQRPNPCHGKNPGSMVSLQMLLLVGPRRQGWGGPSPGLPWPRPSFAALNCRPPVWARAGGSHRPCGWRAPALCQALLE